MKDQETKEKILFYFTVITLCCAGIFGYIFFKNPDSVFGLFFVLSGMVLGVITNLWCAVWGIEFPEDEQYMYFDDYEPHKDIGADPLNIYGTYDKH